MSFDFGIIVFREKLVIGFKTTYFDDINGGEVRKLSSWSEKLRVRSSGLTSKNLYRNEKLWMGIGE